MLVHANYWNEIFLWCYCLGGSPHLLWQLCLEWAFSLLPFSFKISMAVLQNIPIRPLDLYP